MPRYLKGEDATQATVMAYLRAHGVAAFHVPNETKGPVQWLAKRKALGVEAGVPDILIIDPPPLYWGNEHDALCLVGAALELKDGPRKPTDDQERWFAKFASRRWACAVEHSIDHALARLVFWGYLPATVLDFRACSVPSPRVSPSSDSTKPPISRASTRRRSR